MINVNRIAVFSRSAGCCLMVLAALAGHYQQAAPDRPAENVSMIDVDHGESTSYPANILKMYFWK